MPVEAVRQPVEQLSSNSADGLTLAGPERAGGRVRRQNAIGLGGVVLSAWNILKWPVTGTGQPTRAGIAAEETFQLPPRDTKQSDKLQVREEDDIQRGREQREQLVDANEEQADHVGTHSIEWRRHN